MAFNGFGEHAVDFYDGLLADNSRAYWDDHKAIYTEQIAGPMRELLDELLPTFAADIPGASAKVFRPYRDLRFAKDKTPYKTHCGGVIEAGRGGGAYYVQLSADGLLVGGGCYHFEPDQLARYRAAVDNQHSGEALATLVKSLTRKGFQLRGEVLKTRPNGVSAEHPRLELLRHRSLYFSASWPPDDGLHDREALRRVRDAWRALRVFNSWAADHVGPTDKPANRR
ncbi:MAG: DUF2461 domain-containing protein [Sciscionella sp.]|nr:DUF2461 domain-containing protein [Sciscionella sp.]